MEMGMARQDRATRVDQALTAGVWAAEEAPSVGVPRDEDVVGGMAGIGARNTPSLSQEVLHAQGVVPHGEEGRWIPWEQPVGMSTALIHAAMQRP